MLLLPLTNCIRDPAYILETLLLLNIGYICHTAVINFSIADKTNMVMATLEMFFSFSLDNISAYSDASNLTFII